MGSEQKKGLSSSSPWVFLAFIVAIFSCFFSVFVFFIPLPMLMLSLRASWGRTLAGLFLLSVPCILFFLPLFPFFLFLWMLGIIMGKLYLSPRYRSMDVLLVSCGIACLGCVLFFVWASQATWFIDFWKGLLSPSLFQFPEGWGRLLGVDDPQQFARFVNESLQKAMQQAHLWVPGFVVLFLSLVVLINYHVATRWSQRLGGVSKPLPPFRTWVLPRSFVVAGTIVPAAILALGEKDLFLGFIQIFLPLIVVQGFSFLSQGLFYGMKRGWYPGAFRWLVIVPLAFACLFWWSLLLMMTVLGFMDCLLPMIRDRWRT
ncbi:DUF2232 domain-containing protein [Pasteuria penetrans]|uniref:DUF2232 domain-containing protein n=1 Tax=Pasteuria penetrans TaxID=86005 RepID=UPI000FB4A6CE|nr:DUF2232 domain-containing protein [Pasteuria penetrans]